jgi:AcrR family transcriptional regulator
MVQQVMETAPSGRRARNRAARHHAYVRAAQHLVTREGIDALTMQRLADEVDAAVGTIYTYFPSKSALLAEMQRQAIERLTASYKLGRAYLDQALSGDPRTDALARVVGFTRFWVASFDVFPDEAMLLQLLMAEVNPRIAADDAVAVLPAAFALLGEARVCIEAAQAGGALTAGDAMQRTVLLAAAMNGVLLTAKLRQWDEALFDGPRLADVLVADLLTGWGASGTDLIAATAAVDRFARRSPLAPQITDEDEDEVPSEPERASASEGETRDDVSDKEST